MRVKKITLKIIEKTAKKNNTDISEFFAVFMAGIALKRDFDVLIKSYDLDEKEKEILKDFFNFLKNDLINEKDEFIKNFIEVVDLKSVFKNSALFFAVFIPENILESKNADKIRNSLKNYPIEIQEAIIKSLEMLSLANTDIDKELKLQILREVINTIILLTFIIGEFNA